MAMTRGWRVGGARAIENMSSSLKQWKHAVSIIRASPTDDLFLGTKTKIGHAFWAPLLHFLLPHFRAPIPDDVKLITKKLQPF